MSEESGERRLIEPEFFCMRDSRDVAEPDMSEVKKTDVDSQSKAVSLLDRVHGRMKTVALGRSFYSWGMVSVGLGLSAIAIVRLFGLLTPSQQRLEWLAAIPLLTVVLALVFHRRVEKTSAARALDTYGQTRDLFLTFATLGSSAGDYQPLVEQAADRAASRIKPTEVVPFQFGRPLSVALVSVSALILATAFLPQFDPFGKVEAAVKEQEKKEEIVAIRKAARARKEQLQKDAKIAEESSGDIDKQIESLKSSFREMKPQEKQANSKVLQNHAKALNEQWKMVSNEDLRKMLSEQVENQNFGGERGKKLNDWLKDLQDGKSEALKNEIEQAKDTMEAMMEAKTPEDREKLATQLKRQLQDIKKFSSDKANSRELANALEKALKSLEAAQKSGEKGESSEMSEEAKEALQESLELAKAELDEMARNASDMKKLEEALKTLQQAEKLNQNGQMDGEQCEGCKTLAEYSQMLKEMRANGQMGDGEGMGEKGFGKGGEAQEDNSDPEGYKDEKSKSQIKAGKLLMSIKSREYASEKDFDPNELRQYENSVQEIKSGVQAAIEGEQVPPGYVDGIKAYFDKLDNSSVPASGTVPASDAAPSAETAAPPAETPAQPADPAGN